VSEREKLALTDCLFWNSAYTYIDENTLYAYKCVPGWPYKEKYTRRMEVFVIRAV
jgi:hypothetical protein